MRDYPTVDDGRGGVPLHQFVQRKHGEIPFLHGPPSTNRLITASPNSWVLLDNVVPFLPWTCRAHSILERPMGLEAHWSLRRRCAALAADHVAGRRC